MKTKAQKIAFVQQCAEHLKKLPYNTMQLQRIKDFLREKATQYNIPVKCLDASANLVRFTPPICTCVDCQPLVEIHVSNSLLHPAELYVLLQPAIAAYSICSRSS